MRKKFLEGIGVVIFILVLFKIIIPDIHWGNLVVIGIFFMAMNGIVSFLHPYEDE